MAGIAAIVQARTGSTRLPRKSLAPVLGRPLLDLMLERVLRAHTLDRVVVATTCAAADDEIATVARACGALVFRGSEYDVLDRYVCAAQAAQAEVVVRLTADCPLIDPAVIDLVVREHHGQADLVTNTPPHGRSYPDGMDVEVFTARMLARADALATDAADREHVTRRFHRAPFHAAVIDHEPSVGDVRITVDESDDLDRVRAIFEDLYPTNPAFGLPEILEWVARAA
jgi:spore coat polysaccharide biosynthesis protein SpsF